MAGNFNITAQIHLQAPNAKQFSRNLQKQLQNPNIKVNLQGAPKTVKDLNNVVKATKDVEKASKSAGKGADYMGRQLGSAFKQIMKYDIARRVFSLFANAIESGVRDAIAFERAMVKVAQVSGASTREMRALTSEITKVSKQFGVSSQTLAKTSLILKQTGLSMRDTKIAMEALAKTELAPTFDNIADTAEMAVAAMRQFGLEASKLEGLLGKINTVAGQFAVESSDIGVAIRRTGGAFKAAGGEIEELIALFTSVRATTRETAETIATGFRTIFTRLQRPTTIKFLRQFGIELTDLDGKFVGPYKAVEKLHGALKGLDPQDLRYSMIVEQLGGFRQVSKVIPLIQQFSTAQAAMNAQQAESGSLASDAAKAQATLAVQMQKLTEQVKELFREIVGSDSFQMMAKGALALAEGIVKVGKALAPVIPLITAMAGMKMAGWAMGSMKMMGGRGLMASTGSMGGTGGPGFFNRGGRVHRFSRGGWVPGSGNGDTVPAMLEPGEFVLRKSAAQAFGPQLASVNRYGNGTRGSSGVDPDGTTASASPVLSRALFQGVYDGDSYRIHGIPSQQKWNTTTRLDGGVDAYEIKNMSSSGPVWGPREKQLGDLAKAMAESHASKIGQGQDIIGMFGNVDPKKKEKYGRPMMTDNVLKDSLLKAGVGETGKATGTLQKRVMDYAKGRMRAGIKSGPAGKYYTQWVAEERQKLKGPQKPIQRASGGLVPSLLTPGEFVVNKKSAQRFGYGKLSKMNRYAGGGAVRRYANGTGGAGVLPMGFGGGGGFGGMMMQMGMVEGMFGKVGKAGLGAFNGLTSVASSAVMAGSKFAMITQSVGVTAQMFGLQSEALTSFIDRLSMVGGVLSSFAAVAQNPATQAAFNSAIDWAVNGLMIFGGKLKGLGKSIGGKVGGAVSRAGGASFRGAEHVAKGGRHVKGMYQGIFQRGQTKAFREKVLKRQEHYKGVAASKTKAAGHATRNMGELGQKLSASQAQGAKIDADILKNKQNILKSTNDIARAEKSYSALANSRARNEATRIAANKRVAEIGEGFPKLLKKEKHAYETGLKIRWNCR
jgi:TP901 family phage tail tape measure protein